MSSPSVAPERRGALLRDAVFLGWFYLYLVGWVQPHLVYHARSPVFSLAHEFATPFFRVPGGPTAYVSLFLSQLYAWDWLGALVMVLQAALIGFLSHHCFAAVAGRALPFVRFVPLLLYVMACSRYDQWFSLGPSIIGMLLCAAGYLAVARRNPALRLPAFLILTAVCYYATAGALGKVNLVLILFALSLLCGLHEVRTSGCRVASLAWPLAYLILAAAMGYVGERFVFAVDANDWIASWPPRRNWPTLLSAALYLSYPIIGLLSLWSGAFFATAPGKTFHRSAPSAARRRWMDPRLEWLVATALLLWAALGAIALASDLPARRAAHISYEAREGHWDEVLRAARRLPPEEVTLLTEHDVHLALFHTGRLSDDLFLYPRVSSDILLDFQEPPDLEYVWRVADVLLQLGRVNDAQHFSSEALAMFGNNPHVLRQLATILMVKGQLPDARVFLNALSLDLVHGAWARRYLRLLEKDPQLESDPAIARLRRVSLNRDDVAEITLVQEEPVEEAIYLQQPMLENLLAK
ncbi:MAG: DUF6057 family protein, partial [Armatimonadota bacterium]|nr:DUF6057 family protein [Armatimonadota bacterium]